MGLKKKVWQTRINSGFDVYMRYLQFRIHRMHGIVIYLLQTSVNPIPPKEITAWSGYHQYLLTGCWNSLHIRLKNSIIRTLVIVTSCLLLKRRNTKMGRCLWLWTSPWWRGRWCRSGICISRRRLDVPIHGWRFRGHERCEKYRGYR